MKSRGGKSQREEEKKKEDQGRGTVRRQKMQVSEKVAKSQNTVFFHVFPMICGSGGSKSRLAKAAGAEPSGQMRNEKVHAVAAPSTFPSQTVQNTPCSEQALLEVDMSKKVHAVVGRSTCPSQNV